MKDQRDDVTAKIPHVIVSHPFKQHSHHLAYALQKDGLLKKYITSLWYKPKSLAYQWMFCLPRPLRSRAEGIFLKRYHPHINPNLVIQIPQYQIYYEIIKRIFRNPDEDWFYWAARCFDQAVARYLQHENFDIFIGYEFASLRSFQINRQMKKINVLDLATTYYQDQDNKMMRYGMDVCPVPSKRHNQIKFVKDAEIKLADYFLAGSEIVKESFVSAGVPRERIFKIHYGYNPDVFYPKEYYSYNSKFVILYVGMIMKRKGVHLLLQAIAELNIKDIQVLLIGNMKEEKSVMQPFKDFYQHIPSMPHQALSEEYRRTDIFVLPSIIEGFGQVVLEAMGCGTPVIVSHFTGAHEIVRDGQDGFVIPYDKEALKQKILFLYHNRNQVEQMGRSAADRAANYTLEIYHQNVVGAIKNMGKNSLSLSASSPQGVK